jgi:Putative DNA-binding domain
MNFRQICTNLQILVHQQAVTSELLELVLPGGQPLAQESLFWDFKRDFPDITSLNSREEYNAALHEIVKDAVAFHNSYGGFIIAGVDEQAPDPLCGSSAKFRIDDLNNRIN